MTTKPTSKSNPKCPQCHKTSYHWEGCSHSVCPKRAFFAAQLPDLHQDPTQSPAHAQPRSSTIKHTQSTGSEGCFRRLPTNIEDDPYYPQED
jgi:hypothetical protein